MFSLSEICSKLRTESMKVQSSPTHIGMPTCLLTKTGYCVFFNSTFILYIIEFVIFSIMTDGHTFFSCASTAELVKLIFTFRACCSTVFGFCFTPCAISMCRRHAASWPSIQIGGVFTHVHYEQLPFKKSMGIMFFLLKRIMNLTELSGTIPRTNSGRYWWMRPIVI